MDDGNEQVSKEQQVTGLECTDESEQYISKRLAKMELSQLRKSKGISQKELSKVSGLSVQCISDIESVNSGNPTLRSIIKYLECLGYEIAFQKKNI